MLRRYGTFTGGIDLPDEKRATLNEPIRACPPLKRLAVPLAHGGGAPGEVLVSPGDRVRAGDRIAAAGPRGIDVFAPLDGRIAGATQAWVGAGYVMLPVAAVEMTDLSEPTRPTPAIERWDWHAAQRRELWRRIAQAALVSLRARPLPLRTWLDRARRCRTLVVNAVENEPMVTADHRLLVERGREVLAGMRILARALDIADVRLAVESRRTDAYQRLVEPAGQYGVKRMALPHKYPTGADPILVKVLTRREVPPGASPADVGVAVIDAATCLAVYGAVACDRPLTARVVTLAGRGVQQPGNYWVPFGAACGELVDADVKGPLIHGGPMTGVRLRAGAVVSAATNAVLALHQDPPAAPSPCIRCGWCTDHCPGRLNVAALNDAYELKLIDDAARAGALACVGCGVCTYVCPARLPLAQRVKELGRAIRRLRQTMPLFAAPERQAGAR